MKAASEPAPWHLRITLATEGGICPAAGWTAFTLSASESHFCLGHYDKLIRQALRIISEQPPKNLYFRSGPFIIKP